METIHIDGSEGEGGGQVLRNALCLSLWTQTPFDITKIRAGRAKPGLLRQHLTAVRAAQQISGAELVGAELGSRELRFTPGPVQAGDYLFKIGSAGSCTLVLQTVLLPLLKAGARSTVVVEGGTHNPAAPPFDFLARTWLPIVRRMGVDISLELERPGFHPAGGGRVRATIEPLREWQKLELLERGPLEAIVPRAQVSEISPDIAVRELRVLAERLELEGTSLVPEVLPKGFGPGNVVMVELRFLALTEIVSGFGSRNVRAEVVAAQTAKEARRLLLSPAPVGEHLADQLLLPMALAGRGSFRALPLSSHARTAIDVLRRFLPVQIDVTPEAPTHVRVDVRTEGAA